MCLRGRSWKPKVSHSGEPSWDSVSTRDFIGNPGIWELETVGLTSESSAGSFFAGGLYLGVYSNLIWFS